MVVKFLSNTNIRSSPWDFEKKPIGIIYEGTELDSVTGPIAGQMIEGIESYYCYKDEWYFWSGAVEVIQSDEKQIEELEEHTAIEPSEVPIDLNMVSSSTQPEIETSNNLPTAIVSEKKILLQQEDFLRNPINERNPLGASTSNIPSIIPMDAVEPEIMSRDTDAYQKWPDPKYSRRAVQSKTRLELPVSFDSNKMDKLFEELSITESYWHDLSLSGYGVNIAVLDTGIIEHPDLESSIVGKRDFCDSRGLAIDQNGQGTHCAGLMAAKGTKKYWGIAPEAGLIVGKIMETPWDIQIERFFQAISWAMEYPIDMIFTGAAIDVDSLDEEQRTEMEKLLHAVAAKGVIMIGPTNSTLLGASRNVYPAYSKNCLSVNVFSDSRRQAPLSNRQVYAPTDYFMTTALHGGTTGNFSGAVAAAACCTGILALAVQYAHQKQPQFDIPKLLNLIYTSAWSNQSRMGSVNLSALLSDFTPFLPR